MIDIKQRISLGRFAFAPTGKPYYIGPRSSHALAAVQELGLAQSITIFVGLNKGKKPPTEFCKSAFPSGQIPIEAIDEAFFETRKAQVGKDGVGATAAPGRGWYKGDPEDSVAYQVIYVPDGSMEPTWAEFKANVDRLAEHLAQWLCQDSIILIYDNGERRMVGEAAWGEG